MQGRYPSVAVTGDPQPADAPFELAVEAVRDFAPEAPALLRATVANTAAEARTLGFGSAGPISSVWSEDGPVVVLPADATLRAFAFGDDVEAVPDRPVAGCWRTNSVRLIRHDDLRYQTLDAGQAIEVDYVVLHDSTTARETSAEEGLANGESGRCLPAGTYRFEESYPPKLGVESVWEKFEWGFDLAVGT